MRKGSASLLLPLTARDRPTARKSCETALPPLSTIHDEGVDNSDFITLGDLYDKLNVLADAVTRVERGLDEVRGSGRSPYSRRGVERPREDVVQLVVQRRGRDDDLFAA